HATSAGRELPGRVQAVLAEPDQGARPRYLVPVAGPVGAATPDPRTLAVGRPHDGRAGAARRARPPGRLQAARTRQQALEGRAPCSGCAGPRRDAAVVPRAGRVADDAALPDRPRSARVRRARPSPAWDR